MSGNPLNHGHSQCPDDPCDTAPHILRLIFVGGYRHLPHKVRRCPMVLTNWYGKWYRFHNSPRGWPENIHCRTGGRPKNIPLLIPRCHGMHHVGVSSPLHLSLRSTDGDSGVSIRGPLLFLKNGSDLQLCLVCKLSHPEPTSDQSRGIRVNCGGGWHSLACRHWSQTSEAIYGQQLQRQRNTCTQDNLLSILFHWDIPWW